MATLNTAVWKNLDRRWTHSNPIRYQFDRIIMNWHVIPQGQDSWIWIQPWAELETPARLLLFFVEEDRYDGNETKSPYAFCRKWKKPGQGFRRKSTLREYDNPCSSSEAVSSRQERFRENPGDVCWVKRVKLLANGVNSIGDLSEDLYTEFDASMPYYRMTLNFQSVNSTYSNGITLSEFQKNFYTEVFNFMNNDVFTLNETIPITRRVNPRLEVKFSVRT